MSLNVIIRCRQMKRDFLVRLKIKYIYLNVTGRLCNLFDVRSVFRPPSPLPSLPPSFSCRLKVSLVGMKNTENKEEEKKNERGN